MDYEPFSVRQRNLERQGQPVIYQYDVLPHPFRVQVFRILENVIGEEKRGLQTVSTQRTNELNPSAIWNAMWRTLSFEKGLSTNRTGGHPDVLQYLLSMPKVTVLDQLDTIEIAFRVIGSIPLDSQYQYRFYCDMTSDDGIVELNRRLQQHDLGYAFEGGILIRIDSQFMHSEVVSPALQLLGTVGFEGAQDEFLKAHEHFRHGRNEEAIGDALKAFESTMKHICDVRGWTVSGNATAKDLIKAVTENGLFPKSLESHINSLRTILEGLPTVRNKNAGHGSGKEKRHVPDEMAAYALHLSASNIVFLIESYASLP